MIKFPNFTSWVVSRRHCSQWMCSGCCLFQFLMKYVHGFSHEMFDLFISHLQMCAEAYHEANRIARRQKIYTDLFNYLDTNVSTVSIMHLGGTCAKPTYFFNFISRRFMKWNATIIVAFLFFNSHELTKIVLKSSTKYYCTKLHYMV